MNDVRKKQLVDHEAVLTKTQARLKSWDADVAVREKAVAERETDLAKREEMLRNREAEIATREAELKALATDFERRKLGLTKARRELERMPQ